MKLKLLLRPREAADALGIGRTKLYQLINVGELRAVHIGRALRLPVSDVEAYAARLAGEERLAA